MEFAAEGLPEGLSIDSQTGIITGRVAREGNFTVVTKAKNTLGQAAKELRIRIGDTLALTPPMGWNGWNSWAREITGEKVMRSAQAMARLGLKDHGWSYVNIDDTWQGQRGGAWNAIQPNSKFPDFKQMVDQIHALGLRVGVYSTPWISSYAGYVGGSSDFADGVYPDSIKNNKRAFRYVGQYTFETNDALQMAAWGVDYLKYDWRLEVPSAARMGNALRHSGRDIIYSLSNSAPFEHARDWARIANLFRTGSDIRDSWLSLYYSLFTIDKWASFAGPGHWNDPDMMIVGNLTTGSDLHPTRLTPDEQYSEVSLYCLLSAPLLIGCPIEELDPFTLNLLTNDEVIEIDQDPLGCPARFIADDHRVQLWIKQLEDGSYGVGLFNTDNYGQSPASFFRWGDERPKKYQLKLKKLGLDGQWKLRDVWRQADLGVFAHTFAAEIPHHGVVMLRMSRCQEEQHH
jgi:alpha-galactosidase